MKTIAYAAAVASVVIASSTHAGTLTYMDTFGTFGVATDTPPNLNESLTVSGWAGDIPSGATNVQMTVQVRSSLTIQGSATNTAQNAASADITVTLLSDWLATTTDLPGADHVFGTQNSQIVNESIGPVAGGQTETFGPFDNDSWWVTVFSSDTFPDSITYNFSSNVQAELISNGDFGYNFTFGNAGGLRVTIQYNAVGPAPAPIPLAVIGIGLLGFSFYRRHS